MKKRLATLLVGICVLLTLSLYACDKPLPKVDPSLDNDFAVNIEDGEDALVFSPIGAKPTVGLIFYVGTLIDAANYEYLVKALARQGYLTVIPKEMFAFYQYDNYESAYDRFKDVRFFLGGHSQGGGAAIRRARAFQQRWGRHKRAGKTGSTRCDRRICALFYEKIGKIKFADKQAYA